MIELLVVIAIIAMLAALLMPALARAKESGRRARCMANLQQVGLAFQMYADDYGDRYPFPPTGLGANRYYAGMFVTNAPAATYPPPQTASYTGQLMPYYQGVTALLACPSDNGDKGWTPAETSPNGAYDSVFKFWGSSYIYNSLGDNTTWPIGGAPVTPRSTVIRPGEFVLAGDWAVYNMWLWPPPYYRWGWHNRADAPTANLVFADGHVGYHGVAQQPDSGHGPGYRLVND